MSKAVTTSLCIFLLVATAPWLPAQSASTELAVQEAVKRQAERVQLRKNLVEARAAANRGDLVNAAKTYDACWALVEDIGPASRPEAKQTVIGLTEVRMKLAREARSRGDLRDAEEQVKDVLRVNPTDPEAVAFERQVSQMIEAQRGQVPSLDVQEKVKGIENEKIQAQTLVQDGRLLYELGKYDEAAAKLKEALKVDPSNSAALYYAKLVEQAHAREAIARKSIDDQKKLVQVERAWEDSVSRELLPVPNPMARTNLIYTSKGRQTIMNKLDRIRLDNVVFDSLPLSEVVRWLSEEVKKRDPEKKGINFLINPNQETVATTPVGGAAGAGGIAGTPGTPATPATPAFNPETGLPMTPTMPGTGEQAVDINSVNIKISPPLNDVRLADLLDAIVTVADHPIRYSILDYAIVFSLKGPETPELHFRTFKVDPNTFVQGLAGVGAISISSLIANSSGGGQGGGSSSSGNQGGGYGGSQGGEVGIPRVFVSGGGGGGYGGGGGRGGGGRGGGGQGGGLMFITETNNTDVIQQGVINFFRSVGVDLSPESGKNVFFNDREGTLMVRATTQELDIIEAAIQALNIAPPEINIKAKFVEVTQNDSKQLGFDWYLGNYLMANNAVGLQGGTAPSYAGQSTMANPEGSFPGSAAGGTTTPSSPTDQILTSGLRNGGVQNIPGIPAVATLSGILTDPQFRVVLRALEQRDGADLLSEGQVTTMSGRQAQIQVVDYQTIVTGSSVNSSTGGNVAAGGTGVVQAQATQSIQPTTSVIPVGPTLDVVPYVSADGYTIQMTIIPTVVEFLGYDNPQNFIIQAQIGGANAPLTAQLPLPHFRVRQVTTSAIVWDGQTIVLGGLVSESVGRLKDKVPVLGDLPVVGRLFRSESNISQKKNLVIFVTPTIIDPAGNRVHTEDEMPFAQKAVPAQKPVAANP